MSTGLHLESKANPYQLHFTLKTRCPCETCEMQMRFVCTRDVPREIFERKCRCGTKWTIERRTAMVRGHTRIDILEWTPA